MDGIEAPLEHPHKKSGMNKYTIVCALLASTNSILLGYGKSQVNNYSSISPNNYIKLRYKFQVFFFSFFDFVLQILES